MPEIEIVDLKKELALKEVVHNFTSVLRERNAPLAGSAETGDPFPEQPRLRAFPALHYLRLDTELQTMRCFTHLS